MRFEGGYTLVLGDLHLGSVYSNTPALLDVVELASGIGRVRIVVLLGDVVESYQKYDTQAMKSLPNAWTTQLRMVKLLLHILGSALRPEKVVIVLGNHDKDFRGSPLEELLHHIGHGYLEVTDRFYDPVEGALYVHTVSRSRSSGSMIGWSTTLVNRAKTIIINEERSGRRVKWLFMGHAHKNLSILTTAGTTLVLMPSFQMDWYGAAEYYDYYPAAVAFHRDALRIITPMLYTPDDIQFCNNMIASIVAASPEPRLDAKALRRRCRLPPIDCLTKGYVEIDYGGRLYRIDCERLSAVLRASRSEELDWRRVAEITGYSRTVSHAILYWMQSNKYS